MKGTSIFMAAACAAMLLAPEALAQRRKTPAPPAQPDLGAMLRDAQSYTVKVRATTLWPIEGDRAGSGRGTGFVVDKARGWILTNAHVARSSPGPVDISFGDAETDWIAVERVYVDNVLDVAILKLALDKAPPGMGEAKLGCGGAVEQGAAVVAYGHPMDLNFTATRGIVSSVRTLGTLEYIQIDASLNPGNSGGALLSVNEGAVIGIATAGIGGGLNFATPIRHICPILALLRAGKDPTAPTLPVYWLKAGNAETLTVATTFPNIPADFPLKSGDEALGIVGGPAFSGPSDLYAALRDRSGSVDLRVRRAGAEIVVSAPLTPAQPRLARQALAVSGMLIDDDRRADAEASVLPRLHIDYLKPSETGQLAGFRAGDALVEIGGRTFATVADLHAWLAARPAGETVKALVRRRVATSNGLSAEYLRLDLKVEDVQLLSGAAAPQRP